MLKAAYKRIIDGLPGIAQVAQGFLLVHLRLRVGFCAQGAQRKTRRGVARASGAVLFCDVGRLHQLQESLSSAMHCWAISGLFMVYRCRPSTPCSARSISWLAAYSMLALRSDSGSSA